jgi:hypothetical protein
MNEMTCLTNFMRFVDDLTKEGHGFWRFSGMIPWELRDAGGLHASLLVQRDFSERFTFYTRAVLRFNLKQ